jgi:hypothetical protein
MGFRGPTVGAGGLDRVDRALGLLRELERLRATATERKSQGSKNELPDVGPRGGDGLQVEAMLVMLEELRGLNRTSVAGPNGSK